ncbi:MAG: glycosyltransferase family 2 protein [Opitutae bacterium]
MKVSFIIPLYNCLALTQAMLASLRETMHPGLEHEIIFVDDGSTDGTRAWLTTLPAPCRIVLNDNNLGFAGACNRGAAMAQGEFLFFINNDLVLLPHWLEPMLGAFTHFPAVGLVGNVQLQFETHEIDHAGIVIGADGKPVHLKTRPAVSPSTPGYAVMQAVTGACLAISRELFSLLGGFDEIFKNGGEDVDLCFRARSVSRTTCTAVESTVLHHVSASPGRKIHNEENSYRLFHKWRNLLEHEAWRAWCEAYLTDSQAGTIPRNLEAEKAAEDFLHGRHTRPGCWAESNVRQNLFLEEARWEQMFPELSNALAASN